MMHRVRCSIYGSLCVSLDVPFIKEMVLNNLFGKMSTALAQYQIFPTIILPFASFYWYCLHIPSSVFESTPSCLVSIECQCLCGLPAPCACILELILNVVILNIVWFLLEVDNQLQFIKNLLQCWMLITWKKKWCSNHPSVVIV